MFHEKARQRCRAFLILACIPRLKGQKPLPPRNSEITVPTMILISSQTEKFST